MLCEKTLERMLGQACERSNVGKEVGLQKSLQMVTAAMKLKDACSLEESYDQPRQHIKKQRHYFADKGLSSQGYGFSSGHVWM